MREDGLCCMPEDMYRKEGTVFYYIKRPNLFTLCEGTRIKLDKTHTQNVDERKRRNENSTYMRISY